MSEMLQYYCGDCSSVLRKTGSDTQLSNSVEPCPFCGILLSKTLQKRIIVTKPKIQSFSAVFQKASKIPKLTLDIKKLDSLLHFFSINQIVCVSGVYSQTLIERLCVRAQLPHKYGGLHSDVLLIDGANSSDLYQCIDFAQQYGLDVKKTLTGIISSRAFTVYQLATIIIYELENTIKKYNVKFVVISNLLHFFTNDPYLNTDEMKSILQNVIASLKQIQNCLIFISLSYPTKFDNLLIPMFDKTIQISNNFDALSIKITSDKTTNLIQLNKEELEYISLN